MGMMKRLGLALTALAVSTTLALAGTPVLRIAAQEAGTVNWELDTIAHYRLDEENGFAMEIQPVAAGPAGQVAFQGGAADVIVSDWIWVARQRAAGKDFVMLPYSKAVGGVMVPADSPARSLADLAGGKIGIAGGPVDKSWLILRAYAEKEYGLDLARGTEQVFGAPPLIFKAALDGDVDGAVNYWHFMAKMKAAGMRELISVADAASALGLDPETPLLGYVFKGEAVAADPELARSFAARLPRRQGAARDRRRGVGAAASDHEREIRRGVRGAQGRLPRRDPFGRPGRHGGRGRALRADGAARRRGTGRLSHRASPGVFLDAGS